MVPSGTIGLLHKRVKLQQRRWHGAPVLTRFPAPAFFFPPAGSAAAERAVTSLLAQSQSCQPLCFFLSTHISAAAVIRENIGVLESDVTRPRRQAVVAAMTCTKGLVGNLSTEKKGGRQGVANTISPRWSVSPLSVL